MERIPDNYDLWEQHEQDREAEAEKCPECEYCGKKIFDAFAFHIDGEWWHESCLRNEFYTEVIEE